MVRRPETPRSHPSDLTMTECSSLVVVGAGGFGREVAALIESRSDQDATWDLRGFVDDEDSLLDTEVMGYPVLGDVNWLAQQTDLSFVIAIGDGQTRQHIDKQLVHAPPQAMVLSAPSVSFHHTTTVGAGSILCNGAAPTVNVQIGRHVVLDQHCTVGHDSILDDFVTLHPGTNVSGSVRLEMGVTMGSGSVVLPGTCIGARATIGAGAVVTQDIPPDCTAVGVPARPLS